MEDWNKLKGVKKIPPVMPVESYDKTTLPYNDLVKNGAAVVLSLTWIWASKGGGHHVIPS